MPEEPEAELQATANLSPVSPSPVHTASPLVVPALQDTVDTIDAMVAAAAATATNGEVSVADQGAQSAQNGIPKAPNPDLGHGPSADDDQIVDDDDDPYGDESSNEPAAAEAPNQQLPDGNDDYANTFDSPINPEEGADDDVEEDHSLRNAGPLQSAPTPAGAMKNRPQDASDSSSLAHSSTTTSSAAHLEAVGTANADESQSNETGQNRTQPPVPGVAGNGDSQQHPTADLRQLVADLTAQHADPNSNSDTSASKDALAEGIPSPSALPSASSLPPRPPQPNEPSQTYPAQHHPGGSNSGAAGASSNAGQPSAYVAAGALGTPPDAISSIPPSAAAGQPSNLPSYSSQPPAHPSERRDDDYQARWDQFIADERQYMSEAKWDRFPEGSRLFIGNLSSDKVSKRDVFDLFHRFGRLAQISLKSAYGFVQYHTIEEARAAIDNLQSIEIKGRSIHLEVSKLQDKSKKDRNRSPDKGRGSRDGGRRNDRYGNQRDEFRGRNHSPRRNDHQRDSYGRDRGYHDSGRGRGRSRSPSYGRNSRDSYRRRSPSPYGRSRQEPELNLPRRYGKDIPDVQILLQSDINRDFVGWVENHFKAKGLSTNSMFHQPRAKDQIVQHQAAEGVHAVVDLDMHSQNTGRIPVQAFARAPGTSNVRFDQYLDLEPNIAAEVIMQTKTNNGQSHPQAQPPIQPPYNAGGGGGYPTYGAPTQAPPPASYYGAPQPPTYPPQPQQQPPPQVQGGAAADIAALIGKVDPATLQQLVASIQGGQTGGPAAPANVPNGQQMGQADSIQAILQNLNGAPAGPPQQAPQYGGPYGGQPAPQGQQGGGDSSAQVQNIMAQLARYR